MRFDSVVTSAIYSSALLAGGARADDETEASVAEKPSFTPLAMKSAPFFEQFTDDWSSRWIPSKAKKDDPKTDEDWAYVGEWAVEEPTVFKGIEGDKGLVVKNPAAHHAISAKFPNKIDNKKKTLVAQYEVKLQKGLECGGAYMKLLQDNKALHAEEFSNSSPYIIMFGPDKCGITNKVHFIFRHKNPKTGEYEEKHLKNPPTAKLDKLSNLYTLIVKPDQTYQIKINGEEVKSGSLFEDFSPSVNPPKEIDDPKDKKPADWVDEKEIEDPDAKKPADWDEDEPFQIVDKDAEKPADWLDNEPTSIPDPDAEKPEDWDDEEDGDWLAPTVPNPKCDDASGCGKWEPPMIRNPAYKGKWTAPVIENPAYKGEWAPRKIKNPDFYEDKTPANLEPMGAIGFEIWTMQNDILFDNIYVGHSEDEAEKIKNKTFDVKRPVEDKEDSKTPKDSPAGSGKKFADDPVAFIKSRIDTFVQVAQINPVEAAKLVPEVPGTVLVLLLTIVGVVVAALSGSKAPAAAKDAAKDAAKKAGDKAKKAKDAAVDAATTGAEKVQAEVTKRTGKADGAE